MTLSQSLTLGGTAPFRGGSKQSMSWVSVGAGGAGGLGGLGGLGGKGGAERVLVRLGVSRSRYWFDCIARTVEGRRAAAAAAAGGIRETQSRSKHNVRLLIARITWMVDFLMNARRWL